MCHCFLLPVCCLLFTMKWWVLISSRPTPSDRKSWLIGKDSNTGKDWGQEEKGVAEDEMIKQHHQLDGHEFEQTPGDSGGQKEPDMLPSMALQRVRHDFATEQQPYSWSPRPHYLPKSPPPSDIPLGITFQHTNLGAHKPWVYNITPCLGTRDKLGRKQWVRLGVLEGK